VVTHGFDSPDAQYTACAAGERDVIDSRSSPESASIICGRVSTTPLCTTDVTASTDSTSITGRATRTVAAARDVIGAIVRDMSAVATAGIARTRTARESGILGGSWLLGRLSVPTNCRNNARKQEHLKSR
jgi:hypothetical protein